MECFDNSSINSFYQYLIFLQKQSKIPLFSPSLSVHSKLFIISRRLFPGIIPITPNYESFTPALSNFLPLFKM